jgi:hypothetical protein
LNKNSRKDLTKMVKKKQPPKILWALFDNRGELTDVSEMREDVEMEAVGPRWRPYTIRAYRLVKRVDEPK